MKPIDQTEFRSPGSKEKRGNCLMAALASILERPIEEMPVLTNGHDDGSWWDAVLEAAHAHGFTAIYWTNGEPDGFWPYGYHIANGPSPRGEFGHSVVALDGKIVHDPHPSRSGINQIDSWILIYPLARAA